MTGRSLAERLISAGSGLVAFSVLADSAVEHYRGGFANPAMIAPIVSSTLSLGTAVAPRPRQSLRSAAQAASIATGATGLGFHIFNVGKRPGGWRFTNLFYGAPVGAPAALILSGILGAATDALARGGRSGVVDWRSGRLLGLVAAAGIGGTAGEAALLHFRGAYHQPAMWLPVTLPPLAALSLARDVATRDLRAITPVLLGATAMLGLIGAAFHTRGVARRMGGWRNWRQNLLAGPPLPAPPAFTGLALAGIGALLLLRARR